MYTNEVRTSCKEIFVKSADSENADVIYIRPTTSDLAREAGVSLATVDRVLNGRPGVRAVTIERVQQAIEKLRFVRDVGAANLAKQRTYRLVFVLPGGEGQFHYSLREAVLESAQSAIGERTEVQLRHFPLHDPHKLVIVLNELESDAIDGVAILAPETPHVRDAIRRLKKAGVAVVALVSDLPSTNRDHFVGIDNVAAGNTAGVLMGRFLTRNPCKVLVLASSMQSRDSAERRLGFDEIIADQFKHINVLPSMEGHEDADRIEQLLTQALKQHPDVQGIYSLASGNKTVSRILRETKQAKDIVVIAHELTPHNRRALQDGTFDVVITQNVGHIVRSALRVLRAKSDSLPINQAQERIRIDVVLKENMI